MKRRIVCSTFMAAALLLLSSPLSPAYAASPIKVTFQRTYQSSQPIIDRVTTYDYSPTAMLDSDGLTKVWYCSGDAAANGVPGDGIAYTSLAPGQNYLSPITVLNHSGNSLWNDGQHACAPTVVKHSTPSINNGAEMYSMYYECQKMFYDNLYPNNPTYAAGPTDICHAISSDGINWQVLGEDGTFGDPKTTPPKVLFSSAQKIKDQCHIRLSDNKYWIDHTCSPGSYGVGHPSAIVKNVDGKQQIWLWYFDSRGEDRSVIYLAKSFDGIHFDTPAITSINRQTYPVSNKAVNFVYVDIPVGNYPGYYLVMSGSSPPNIINLFYYSIDGISWADLFNTPNPDLLKIGLASGPDTAGGPNTIVTDPYGIVHSATMDIISGEGSISNSGTWALWLIRGIFTATLNCPAGQTCLTRGEGAKVLADQFGLSSTPPTTATFGDVPKDAPYFQAVEAFWANMITSGCMRNPLMFCSGFSMSRADAATFLLRIAKFATDPTDTTPRFADVPQSYPLFAYVQLFGKLGITVGCSQNPAKFCPDDPITLNDLNVYIARIKDLIPTPGDFNRDDKVNIDDYTLLQANFGNPYTIFDFNLIVGNFGK